MPRVVDLHCSRCDVTIFDKVVNGDVNVICVGCGQPAEEIWWGSHHRPAQWNDRDAVVVFRRSDGTIKYPGRNDLPTPPGCERVTMKSLREVENFERTHNVRNEAMHYDRGSGTKRPDDSYYGRDFS